MEITQIVTLLVGERDRLSRAIEALQGPTKRRGRPAKNTVTAANDAKMPDWVKPAPAKQPTRKKRRFTAAQRKKQAESMKAYWATKKKQAGTK